MFNNLIFFFFGTLSVAGLQLISCHILCPADTFFCKNQCYFKTNMTSSWSDAKFICNQTHHGSSLAVLDNKEKDKNIRNCMLELKSADEVWIDGIYNAEKKEWVWGKTAQFLNYQAFSRKIPEDDSAWKCIILNPELLHRWSARNCLLQKLSLCEL